MSRKFDLINIVNVGLRAMKRAKIPLYRREFKSGTSGDFYYLELAYYLYAYLYPVFISFSHVFRGIQLAP